MLKKILIVLTGVGSGPPVLTHHWIWIFFIFLFYVECYIFVVAPTKCVPNIINLELATHDHPQVKK